MKVDLDLRVHHLTRVEGHGNIRVRVQAGVVTEASWQVVETPRYFEAMLKGKHFTMAGLLAARICGICSIGHCLAAQRATEAAFGIVVPPAAARLRLLAKHGETLQSHWLHLFFLVAPDLLDRTDILPGPKSDSAIFNLARRLKGVANRLSEAIAGRSVHPVALQVGGVSIVPGRDRLADLRDELTASLADIAAAADFFAGCPLPEFRRETEFVSLQGEDSYPWIGGRLISSDGVETDESDYLAMTNEYVTPDNTSKWCRLSRPSFAVGALARCHNNFRLLDPAARAMADRFGLAPGCHNPFMNNIAQLVECVQITHEAIRLLNELLDQPAGPTLVPVAPGPAAASPPSRSPGASSTTATSTMATATSGGPTASSPPPRTTPTFTSICPNWCASTPPASPTESWKSSAQC